MPGSEPRGRDRHQRARRRAGLEPICKGSGDAVGILGGLDDKPAEIRANGGDDPVLFPYSDFGVDQVGYCISTRRDTVEDNPDLVNRFVDATMKAYAGPSRSLTRRSPPSPTSSAAPWPRNEGKAQARARFSM